MENSHFLGAQKNTRSFKHELRTPINHIIGYGALLLDAGDETSDELLSSRAAKIHAIGIELSKAIEKTLLYSDCEIGSVDILAIKAAITPLILNIYEELESLFVSTTNESCLGDL